MVAVARVGSGAPGEGSGVLTENRKGVFGGSGVEALEGEGNRGKGWKREEKEKGREWEM